jgi:hypothetical protein
MDELEETIAESAQAETGADEDVSFEPLNLLAHLRMKAAKAAPLVSPDPLGA